jgi:glycosyltransferase involved in cell wall biosynthesis
MSKIEFIIPTYNRPEKIMVILSSLVCQTNNNWTAHVVIDGLTNEYRTVKDIFQNNPQIRFSHIEDGPSKDWGHTPRQYGLDNAKEEWVVMTGDDNYYVPVFVDEMLKDTSKTHFVYCNMVHNWVNNEYIPIDSEPKRYRIDIGNFMVRTELGKQIKLHKHLNEADGIYVEEFLSTFKGMKPKKVNKILYVHN